MHFTNTAAATPVVDERNFDYAESVEAVQDGDSPVLLDEDAIVITMRVLGCGYAKAVVVSQKIKTKEILVTDEEVKCGTEPLTDEGKRQDNRSCNGERMA